MNGKTKELIASHSSMPLQETPCTILAIGCAYAITGDLARANEILEVTKPEESDHAARSLVETCLGYIALEETDYKDFLSHMDLATSVDPGNPLPWYSLGLDRLWQRRDFDAARHFLQHARNLAPESGLVVLSMFGLEAEAGNLGAAKSLFRDPRLKNRLTTPQEILMSTLLWLAASPLGGGLVALLICFALFMPYMGAPLVALLTAFATAAFLVTRNVSPRLAILPAIYSIAWLGTLFIRTLILGRAFP